MTRTSSREEALFTDAIALPREQRAAFLEGACRGDPALRERVRALLEAHAQPDSLLASARKPSAAVHEERQGDRIGHFKLLQKLGEGGCGVVWMAEQAEPVRRRVALKIIKLGMDTKAVVARFEAERQALAMMDHPNIAKVHDAGATENGRPYFVMELVRGIPITKYCDENHLTPPARLELFIHVCQAVQHAHQKGIIHRDLKPSNILVTVNDGAPTPKVIDFGIAKATQGRLTDATVFTQFEQFIGTPVYMSPEQAEMSSLDIDTRSDIYSLGVLLYELLTGRSPFDPKKFAEAGVEGIRQQIRELEPPRPSVRLSTLGVARASRPCRGIRTAIHGRDAHATHAQDADLTPRAGRPCHDEPLTTIAHLRSTTPRELISLLRGDLDWIVMRCIEKDRTRRYDTANGLAADIQRYLRNEPVVARPPSTAYLLQKLVTRHKVGFAAGAIVGMTLLAGFTFSTLAFVREKAARTRALAAEISERTGRQRAEVAETAAEKSALAARGAAQAAATGRLHAEELLSFVFTDLAERLDDYGLVPELHAMSEKVIAYYEALPASSQTRQTRASYAFALSGIDSVSWMSLSFRHNRARLEQAIDIFEQLESTTPLGAFERVTFAAALSGMAAQHFNDNRPGDGLPYFERAEQLLPPALNDERFGTWAQRTLTKTLTGHAVYLGSRSDALPVFKRALESADETDRRTASRRRPGLLAARIKAEYSRALFRNGRRNEARQVVAEARATLRPLVESEPHLATARLALALAAGTAANQAFLAWKFDEATDALRESESQLTVLLKVDPENAFCRGHLARTLAAPDSSWLGYHWGMGDFRAVKVRVERAVQSLSQISSIPRWRSDLLRGHLQWARVCAATGDNDEVDRQLAAADTVQHESLAARVAGYSNSRRGVEFERLNWAAVRKHAQDTIKQSANARLAHRDLMRAAFEMGDHATARHTLEAWAPGTDPLPSTDEIQQRFNRLGDLLLRIHVLARGGEPDFARAELARIWPEVDAVLAAGPDHLFNQVQTARALSIRAEIDKADTAAKRRWLEHAAGWLRPASAAGKLTRYECEVLLAGIEKQLTALPP